MIQYPFHVVDIFDRRLKTISTADIKEKIINNGYLFVAKGLAINQQITAIDSTILSKWLCIVTNQP